MEGAAGEREADLLPAADAELRGEVLQHGQDRPADLQGRGEQAAGEVRQVQPDHARLQPAGVLEEVRHPARGDLLGEVRDREGRRGPAGQGDLHLHAGHGHLHRGDREPQHGRRQPRHQRDARPPREAAADPQEDLPEAGPGVHLEVQHVLQADGGVDKQQVGERGAGGERVQGGEVQRGEHVQDDGDDHAELSLMLLHIEIILTQVIKKMASNFPLLPGFAPTQEFKEHYKKVSAKKQEDNRDVNKLEPTKYPLPRQPNYEEPVVNNTPFLSTSHDHFNPKNAPRDSSKLYQPDWVHLDRHVLRFFGYFKESVVESNQENCRNRKVKVLFYLEDNSISINQQKFQNSGIPQGKFLKREKYVQENGKFLTAYDLRIGQAITLYGRSIYLYNCDDYTREFYERASQPQGPAESYDNDQWTSTLTNKWVPKKDAQMKDYLEKKLGGGKVNSEKQFLENDRKVLKFYARFEGSPFIVHYFLADDTVEVREVALPNSGKDPFPVTFRRQKLAKNFALNQPGQTYAENFLKAEELSVGRDLHVFGRYYSLEGCDDFTRDYYLHKFNIVFPPSGASSSGKEAPKSNIIIPPHNGIGSEEDSLGYIFRLIPKPPKKDFFKWVDQQIGLRFNAVFASPKPEDSNRKFIITYYLNDDSLQIYEPPAKNSGFWNGKFLERGSYKTDNGEVIKPEHLIVGQDLKINGYFYHLTDCDDFTKKWYAENTEWAA